jgi:hypothetical protein
MERITLTKKAFDEAEGFIGQEWIGTRCWALPLKNVANGALFLNGDTAHAWNSKVVWYGEIHGVPYDEKAATIVPDTPEGKKPFTATNWLYKGRNTGRLCRLFTSEDGEKLFIREDYVSLFNLELVYSEGPLFPCFVYEHDYNMQRISDEVQAAIMPYNIGSPDFPQAQSEGHEAEGTEGQDRHARAA